MYVFCVNIRSYFLTADFLVTLILIVLKECFLNAALSKRELEDLKILK